MSERLPRISSTEVLKVVKRLGFELDRQSGSHAVYYHSGKRLRIVVPIHKKKIIKPKTLRGIIEDLEITVEEFKKLL